MTTAFTLTYDYLCPFARIANETVVHMLERGDDYDVTFMPFSLTQNHRGPEGPAVWDDGEDLADASGVRALLWSLAVRDEAPEAFGSFHRAVFDARHDDGADINDPVVLARIAEDSGLDAAAIGSAVGSGIPMKVLRDEHTRLVEDHAVFGVPTFIADGEAVFVRFMERHRPDDVARVIDMIGWSNVNEFKRTTIPR